MADEVRYEVWLPGKDRPEELHYDGDRAARRAREIGGVMVPEGASKEDRETLFASRFPTPDPVTSIPAGVERALGQARTQAQYDALEEASYKEAMEGARSGVPKAVADMRKQAEQGQKELQKRQKAHAEAERISMTEPERYAGGEPTPLPEGTEVGNDGTKETPAKASQEKAGKADK